MERVTGRGTEAGTAKNLASGACGDGIAGHFARKNALAGRVSDTFDRPIFWPVSQFFTGHTRILAFFSAVAVAALVAACGGRSEGTNGGGATGAARREAVGSIRNEPRG